MAGARGAHPQAAAAVWPPPDRPVPVTPAGTGRAGMTGGGRGTRGRGARSGGRAAPGETAGAASVGDGGHGDHRRRVGRGRQVCGQVCGQVLGQFGGRRFGRHKRRERRLGRGGKFGFEPRDGRIERIALAPDILFGDRRLEIAQLARAEPFARARRGRGACRASNSANSRPLSPEADNIQPWGFRAFRVAYVNRLRRLRARLSTPLQADVNDPETGDGRGSCPRVPGSSTGGRPARRSAPRSA